MNFTTISVFIVFLLITFAITGWAARRTGTRNEFYAAGGSITGVQNGFAFAGDYMSAATLLGIAGLYFTSGLDGFVYNVGGVVGWPILLFLLAERLRQLGRYTLTDVLSQRLDEKPIRIFAASANLVVLTFYMVSQMVGAGILMNLLLGLSFAWSALLVGTLMTVYVVFGGMIATTWVQIVKAALLIAAAIGLAGLTLGRFDFSVGDLLATAAANHATGDAVMGPSTLIAGPGAAISLGLTLLFGPAGLPHILMRFFTVPNVQEARKSANVAAALVGGFCILMVVIGYGTVAILTGDPTYVDASGALIGGSNMASLYLAKAVGGDIFLGFVAAIAFATILAVVSGLTLAAAATISHDLYSTVVRDGKQTEAEEMRVSRWSAFVFAAISIALSLAFQHENINILAATAFSIAASATFPVLILALFWKPLTTAGAIAGGVTGLVTAAGALILGPSVWVAVLGHEQAIFPYQYPTILSMPLAFIVAFAVSLVGPPRAVLDPSRSRS
jgi:cation/acetate symporter